MIATVLVIVAGFALISPLFFRPGRADARQKLMLSFTVTQCTDDAKWCKDLSSMLETFNLGASVFVPGNIAKRYPECLSYFADNVDIGSQTYSGIDLTGISDYSQKLAEVQQGKAAVDNAGNLYSRSFQAPFGATDQDIYSLLSRSDILTDFSYNDHYNVYQNGQFVRYGATIYEAGDHTPDWFLSLPGTARPIIITFDDSYSISDINEFLSVITTGKFEFVNASQLTGLTLTHR